MPELVKRLHALGNYPDTAALGTPEALVQFIRDDFALMARILKAANLLPEELDAEVARGRLTAATRCGSIALNCGGGRVESHCDPSVRSAERNEARRGSDAGAGPRRSADQGPCRIGDRPLDAVVRAGKYARRVTLPLTPGFDPSGIVTKLGPGVTGRKVGDRVTVQLRFGNESGADLICALGVHAWGGYAERDARGGGTAIVPESLDFATATVVSRHTPTAFTLLRDRAKLQAGEWVLVMGAAGGLGSAGIQVAKYLGAKVIAAAGAAERVKVGLDLGADAGVNYRAQDLTMEAMRITEGKGVNVVFENIGDPDLFPKAFAAMARRGRLVTAGGHAAASCRSTSTGSIRITSPSSARPARRRRMSRSASRPRPKGASRWWSTASCRCRRPCRRTN